MNKCLVIDVPDGLHQDSVALIIDTANAMAAKLFKSQEKYGFKNGWRVPPDAADGSDGRHFWTREDCLTALFHHMEKGDPVDCINYLAFMLENGWATELPSTQEQSNDQ